MLHKNISYKLLKKYMNNFQKYSKYTKMVY